jgi:Ribbon-helix-helix protein, copG family
MLNKRTRPVNIRVSQDDFQKLREACEKMGTRNVSELAREALRLIVDEHRSVPVSGRDAIACLNDLASRLTDLQIEVERLKALLN